MQCERERARGHEEALFCGTRVTFQETLQQGVRRGQEAAGRPGGREAGPDPTARGEGADPWEECRLPKVGRLGSRQGVSCEVPRARLQLGWRSMSMERWPGKEAKQLGATAQDPAPLLEPAVTPQRTPTSPEGTWGHCRQTCPKGTGWTAGAWGAGHPAPGWPPPRPPKPRQHRERVSQGRQGPKGAPCAGGQKEVSTEATPGRHGAWSPQSWERRHRPLSTDTHAGSQSLGADQGKSATGHKTGPYSPLL